MGTFESDIGLSIPQIAERCGTDRHRIRYIVTYYRIEPCRTVIGHALFDEKACRRIARINGRINAQKAQRAG